MTFGQSDYLLFYTLFEFEHLSSGCFNLLRDETHRMIIKSHSEI